MPIFFSIGFRPFFASGTLFAAIALLIWGIFWHSGANLLSPAGGMLFWHPHELLMGFAQAIIIGFLLTAARNWTGLETATPSILCLLFACWWSARAIMAFGEGLPLFVLVISQVITPLIAAVCIGTPIIKKQLWHNLFAPALLVLMALLDSSMLIKIQTSQVFPSDLFNISILTVVLLMTMIGGRIIPLFTANRLSIPKPEESRLSLVLCALPIILLMIIIAFGETLIQGSGGIASWPAQVVLAVLSAAHIRRLIQWHTMGIWKHPMLWSLFVFYAGIPAGFALLMLKPQLQLGSVPWHMLTVGAMSGLILSMVARVSLGHTGRVIVHDRIILAAFISLIASAILRTLGVALFSLHPYVILSSAVLASFSMALIFARFIIIWLSPRPDAS
jgi:uncharacterized protein involved in response to NO